MRPIINTLLLLLFFAASVSAFGQADKIKIQIDSLKYVRGDAFACNSPVWRIVANKKEAIQYLINKLDDTTMTNATYKCKKVKLCVGDLAFLTLDEILPLPFFAVTGMQCDVLEDGCQMGVFDYIDTKRKKFKQQVQQYYDSKKATMQWVWYDSNRLTPCRTQNNIKGFYIV